MKYAALYAWGAAVLEEAGVPEARLDARLLLEHVCHTALHDLYGHGDREVDGEDERAYRTLLAERKKRIPLQYLTGEQEFMGLCFSVNENVLIPRQDTELLAEEALKRLHDGMRILDVCTGSGCVLLSLLRYSNDCTGVGTDISAEALAVAEENLRRLFPEGAGEGEAPRAAKETPPARFIRTNLLEGVEGKFDLLVANPPYIPSGEIDTLQPEVREHEPRAALDGKEDGLFFYREILRQCPKNLYRGSRVLFEIGSTQGEAVGALLAQSGFREIGTVRDYAGLDRVVTGEWLP